MTLNRPKFHPRDSFSLVELLVAILILSVIFFLMSSFLNQASRAWLTGVGQNERRSNGRMLLDFVARDLKIATLPTRSLAPSGSTPAADLQFFANISTAPDATKNPTVIPAADMNPHAIFWQAPVATVTTYGNIAEVGYFIRWDTTTKPGTAIATMCRFLVNPGPIVSNTPAPSPPEIAGNTASTNNFQIYNRDSGGNPFNWLSGTAGTPSTKSVIDAVAPASATESYQGWFADNVIAFWIRCLDAQGNPITTNAAGDAYPTYGYDSRQGYTETITPSSGSPYTLVHAAPALPAAIDLAIVTVDSATAARIKVKPTYTITTPVTATSFSTDIDTFMTSLPATVKTGAQLFSTTVYIPTK